ncbi:MAG: hypothetical protein WC325_10705, partial [Candidatus Bathyarchaeia archaeon]
RYEEKTEGAKATADIRAVINEIAIVYAELMQAYPNFGLGSESTIKVVVEEIKKKLLTRQ